MTRHADADRLATLLEAVREPEEADHDVQGLLVLAEALRDAAPPTPPMRPEFRADLRAQVVQAARDAQPEAPLLTRLRDRAHRMRYSTGFATGSGVVAMALSGGGVAAAAEGALPGDALYGVKIGIEDLRLAATGDEAAAGARAVTYAFDRLDEAAVRAAEGDDPGAATALRGATERMSDATDRLIESGLLEPMLDLADAVATQRTQVAVLVPELGPQSRVAADALVDVLDRADQAVADAVVAPIGGAVPDLPQLPVPGASATDATATPVPAPTPTASTAPPTGTATPTPLPGGGLLPGGQLPDVPLPDAPLPDTPLPDTPLPGPLPDVATPGSTQDALDGAAGGVLDGVGEATQDALDGLGDATDDLREDVVDSVEPVLPSPLATPLQSAPSALDGAVDDAAGPLGDTIEAVDDTVGGVAQDIGGVTSGLLGGG